MSHQQQRPQQQYSAANSGFLNDLDPNEGGRHQPYPEHDPRDTPKFGKPAKKTMPMAPNKPLSVNDLWPTREICWDCNGTAVLKHSLITKCRVCRRWWSRAQVIAKDERTRHGVLLPCNHEVRGAVTFEPEPCYTCRSTEKWTNPAGPGYLAGWRPISELMNLFQEYFRIPNASVSDEMRALFQLQQSQPSAPSPHLAVNTPVYIHAEELLNHVSAGPAPAGQNHNLAPLTPLMPDEWEEEQIRLGLIRREHEAISQINTIHQRTEGNKGSF